MRYAQKLLPLLLVAALAACSDTSSFTGPGGETDVTGTVVGEVEQTTTASGSLSPSFSMTASADANAAGMTVATARVKSDGALEVLAEAEVASDGSFRIEEVPAGESGLVVVVSEAGESRGRALIHGSVPANGQAFVTPVDGESTVEAHVLSELKAQGLDNEGINTALIALGIEPDGQSTAEALLSSRSDLQALAQGIHQQAAVYGEVLNQLGLDVGANARAEAALPAAQAMAEAQVNGTAEEEAENAFGQQVVDALQQQGVGLNAQVQAASAAGTGLSQASSEASSEARLAVARAAQDAHLEARAQNIEGLLDKLGVSSDAADQARNGLEQAKSAIESADTPAEAQQGVEQALSQIEDVLAGVLSSRMPSVAESQIRSRIDGLPDQTDLSSQLGASADATSTAQAYVSFFSDLRTQVQTMVSDLAGSGGGVNGSAVADFFASLRGVAQTS